MYNVDTISMCMQMKRYTGKEIVVNNKIKKEIDWNYTNRMKYQIISKMVLYENDKYNREMNKRYNSLNNDARRTVDRFSKGRRKEKTVYWHAKYDGYYFTYNENWQTLTVMLPHNKIEQFRLFQIKGDVLRAITEYYKIDIQDLNELTLTRLDIKCDYQFKDQEEYKIIMNILDKAPKKYNKYIKDVIKDDKYGYILTYSSTKTEHLLSKIEYIEDKWSELEYEDE